MTFDSPVTQDELHALVDGELPADRADAVAAWLATHPDDAALVAQWRAQAETIRARFGAVASEPVPARFNLDRLNNVSRRSWRSVAAAAVLALLAGGVGGWVAHATSATTASASPADVFTSEALGAHKLYIGEMRHPIEVRAEEQHLLPWLSRRVGTVLRAPDLASFDLKLLGGRLLPGTPGANGPAAMMMYEGKDGERYTIYCRKTAAAQAALSYSAANETAAVRWVDTEFGYAVSGPADRSKLLGIAEAVYDQLDRGRAPRTEVAPPPDAAKRS